MIGTLSYKQQPLKNMLKAEAVAREGKERRLVLDHIQQSFSKYL